MFKVNKKLIKTSHFKQKRDWMKGKISRYLVLGLDIKEALTLAECSQSMFNKLRSDPEFDNFVDKAIAESEKKHLEILETSAKLGQWQASAWFLERKFPERWGKRDIIKHEYDMKLSTFKTVVLNVLEKIDPSLKFKVLHELSNYQLTADDVIDTTAIAIKKERLIDGYGGKKFGS